jgi:glycosyltransferase involved in cell wall biosynthesis
MNILLVIPFDTNGTAGVGRIVRNLQQSLAERGFKTCMLMASDTNTIEPVDGLDWNNTYGIHYRFMSFSPVKGFLAFWFYLPIILYDLARFLRRKRIDIVHINFPSPVLIYFAILRPFARWKLVATFLGSDINNLDQQNGIWRWFVKLLLRETDLIIACSQSLLEKLCNASGQYCKKAILIPNANPLIGEADRAIASAPTNDGFVLSVGSLIYRKGHDVLIRAAGIAKERGFRINIVIVGGGPNGESLQRLAQEIGVSDQIELAGEIQHAAMSRYYVNCRYFVLATRAEGMPVAVLEAMGCGKPVVATDVDGIPEIVRDGDTGFLVPSENAEALASAMIRLECDGSLRSEIGDRARKFVLREHTWAKFTERNIRAYRRAAGVPDDTLLPASQES